MFLKKSRTASFAVIAFIYIAVSAAGVAVYRLLPYDTWLRLLIADIAATVLTFAFSLLFGNASVYDPYWSVQPMVILTAFAVGGELTAARLLMLAAVLFWGVRLTANWAYTFQGLEHQDWRYTMLREKTGRAYPVINFVGIHLVPTLVVYGCTLPAVYVFENDVTPNAGSLLFFALSVFAVIFQGVADMQMHAYRRRRMKGGESSQFVRTGLWKHSRHPNYLGEIAMWWGVALAAVSVMPERWYLIAGAAANTCLFLFVSIPLADGRQSLKPGFEKYKNETRMLLPVGKRG